MKLFPFPALHRLLPLCVLPLVAGCSSMFEAKPDLTRYYLLTAPAAPATVVAAPAAVAVGLCRIEMPAYLRTPELALRPGGTELRHAPEALWGEPLELGIARVLKETLQAQPAVRVVVAYPAPQAAPPDFEISVTVLACEGLVGPEGRQARFAASWEVRFNAPVGAVLASGTFESAPAEWAEGDYAALTAKLGQAVAALGRELGAKLGK